MQKYNKAIMAAVAVTAIIVLQTQGIEVSQTVVDEFILGLLATFGVYQVPNKSV